MGSYVLDGTPIEAHDSCDRPAFENTMETGVSSLCRMALAGTLPRHMGAMPDEILVTMAKLIGRTAGCYFPPTECEELVAFVALALGADSTEFSPPLAAPRN